MKENMLCGVHIGEHSFEPEKIIEEINEREIGKTLEVLCDGYDTIAEIYYGRTYQDAPDIDGRIYFSSSKKINKGDIVRVKVNEALDYDLVGERID